MRARELIGLGAFQFLAMNRRAVFYSFLAIYAYQRLGASLLQVGLLSALPMFANSGTQPLWGRLSDRTGKRRLFIALGETVAGVAYLAMSGLSEIWSLTFGLTALEAVWSMSSVAWSALIVDVTEPVERGRVMGYINTIGVVGWALGVFVAGILYDVAGFEVNFVVSAAMMFAGAAIVWMSVDDRTVLTMLVKDSNAGARQGRGCMWLFRMLVLTSSVSMFGVSGARHLMMIYMGSGIGFSGMLIGLISALGSLIELVFGIPVGYLSDKVGRSRLYAVSLAVNAAAPAVLLCSQTPLHFAAVSALMSMSWPLSETTAFPLASEFATAEDRGRLLGYFNSARFLLGFGLPPFILGGFLAGHLKHIHLLRGFSETEALILSSRETFVTALMITLAASLIWATTLKQRNHDQGSM